MNTIKELLIKRDGEEEAIAEIEMVCENIEYDMETMSFAEAIQRALDDVYLEKDYAEEMANCFYQWESTKANKD
jgi:hypothetical protein